MGHPCPYLDACLVLALIAVIALIAEIFLVRWNHEFRDMNEGMGDEGFLAHMKLRLPKAFQRAYYAIHNA